MRDAAFSLRQMRRDPVSTAVIVLTLAIGIGANATMVGTIDRLLFRAPAGIQNPWLAAVLAKAGLSLVSWTRRGFDTVSRDAGRVASRLGRRLSAGDILLLHYGSSARDASGQPVVLSALPRVLDEMGRKGLRSEALHTILKKQERESCSS